MPAVRGKIVGIESSLGTNYASLYLNGKKESNRYRFTGDSEKAPFLYSICVSSLVNDLEVEIVFDKDNGSQGIISAVTLWKD